MDAGVCKPTCNWGHQLVGQTVSKCSTDGNVHGNINGYEWHMGYESLYIHTYIYIMNGIWIEVAQIAQAQRVCSIALGIPTV